MEALEDYLDGCLGTTKLPLAYIVRHEVTVPSSSADPATVYATLAAGPIARGPHETGVVLQVYTSANLKDHKMLWQKIADLTQDHECWTYGSPTQRTRDGRAAFLASMNTFWEQIMLIIWNQKRNHS
jgi:hypothetical protein